MGTLPSLSCPLRAFVAVKHFRKAPSIVVRWAERHRWGQMVFQLSHGGWSRIGMGDTALVTISQPYELSLSPQISHPGSGRLTGSGPGHEPGEWCLLTLSSLVLGELGRQCFSLWNTTAFALKGEGMTRMGIWEGVWSRCTHLH